MFTKVQLIAVIFHLMIFSVLAGEPPTILALGDSITQGGKHFQSYRDILVSELRGKNVAARFIGPTKDAVSSHAGYSGKNSQFLLGISNRIYKKYPADIVMIHAGHNHFNKDNPVLGIVRDTEAIIKNIRAINPEVKILLSEVIPSGKLPKYAYIPKLNEALKVLVDRLVLNRVNISLVNNADGFDWKKDTVQDKVHPNLSGARKMSNRWMAALLPALGHTKMLSTERINIWDDIVPSDLPEKELARGRVSQVSVPTLDIYRPEKPNGVSLLICSGGGYRKLASGPLGLAAADEFLKNGFTVFSLKYRLSPPSKNVVQDACDDGARAIRIIRSRAKEWNLDPKRVGMIGFSAGANMILNLACKNDIGDPKAEHSLDKLSGHPNFMVLACLWRHKQKNISDFSIHKGLPPTLILSAKDDKLSTADQANELATALRAVKVPVKLELYDKGGHLGFNFPSPFNAGWPQLFRNWLEKK